MIDAKRAAEAAREYMVSLYPSTPFGNLQVEEIELSDDKKFWYITLSYLTPGGPSFVFPQPKDYKIFKINTDNGEVLSMKIRQLK